MPKNTNTKFCTNCGSEVDVNAVACVKCGAALSKAPNAQQQASKKFCTNCGAEIDINAVVCPKCGVAAQASGLGEPKNVGIAVLLNILIPGLGHIINDLTHRGLTFLVMYIISAALIILFIGIILAPLVWIWAVYDVYKCINALNAGEHVEDKLF